VQAIPLVDGILESHTAWQTRGKENSTPPMKRAYEVSFIVRLDTTDETAINNTVDLVRAWVEAGELGQVQRIDRWGRRKLAYEIEKQREGYYVFMESQIEPNALIEIERNLNLSPFILRYLIVRKDE
jgi:small subunit ribosomal protein S6